MPQLSLTLAAAAPAAPGGAAAFILQIFPFLLIFVIFYFLMIRPQQKKMRDHQAMIAAVKKGDEVITAGGIRARVTRLIDEREVEVEIAQGVKVRVVRATLSQVLTATPKGAND
nr:preprotein translocase subunit YajC [uncultured Sphingomonas sp.]